MSRIPLPIGVQKTSSTNKNMYSTWSRNPRRGIQNPTMPWIPLRGAKASHRFPEYKKNFAKRKSKKQNKLIWQTTHLIHHGS